MARATNTTMRARTRSPGRIIFPMAWRGRISIGRPSAALKEKSPSGSPPGRNCARRKDDMDEFNELSLTDAVIERLRATPDPRLQNVVMSAVRHLHDFVRDVRPTFDEWLAAIRFLTRVGQISDETRQEFILLSDIFGVSMLVDAINHPPSSEVTDTTVLGPFYGEPPPEHALGADIANGAAGEPLCVDVEIKSADGKLLP